MNKKSTGLLLSILGVLSLVLITAGVTYAFFTYAKEGVTENKISTGTITFYYDELDGAGNGIQITDALPMSDDQGKLLAGTNEVFNFKVTSTVSGDTTIPYTVTVRKKADSTLDTDKVKLYLTANETNAVTAGTNYTTDSNGDVKLFSQLSRPTTSQVTLPNDVDERVVFTGVVPAKTNNYSSDFTLRMWISEGTSDIAGADYSPYEFVKLSASTGVTTALDADTLITNGDFITSTAYYGLDETARAAYERIAYVNTTDRTIYTVSQASVAGFTAPTGFDASEQFYQLNGQTFTVTVNVYASATVVSSGN